MGREHDLSLKKKKIRKTGGGVSEGWAQRGPTEGKEYIINLKNRKDLSFGMFLGFKF